MWRKQRSPAGERAEALPARRSSRSPRWYRVLGVGGDVRVVAHRRQARHAHRRHEADRPSRSSRRRGARVTDDGNGYVTDPPCARRTPITWRATRDRARRSLVAAEPGRGVEVIDPIAAGAGRTLARPSSSAPDAPEAPADAMPARPCSSGRSICPTTGPRRRMARQADECTRRQRADARRLSLALMLQRRR